MRILQPSYCYPSPGSPFWDTIFAHDTSRLECVLNPANGPGFDVEPNYAWIIRKLRQRTIPILGYVATTYGNKPIADVQKEIAMWSGLYAVADIFLDEVSAEIDKLSYYQNIYGSARGRIVNNPGTVPGYEFSKCGDITITAECGLDDYLRLKLPDSLKGRKDSAHIVHGVRNEGAMRKVVGLARKRASYVYCCDSSDYDTLPNYYPAFVKEVSR